MSPNVLHHANSGLETIEEGMVFTIEPILTMFEHRNLYTCRDRWTIVSENNPSAQAEHTVLVNRDGPEVLTQLRADFPEQT